jgi:hypothetical protein
MSPLLRSVVVVLLSLVTASAVSAQPEPPPIRVPIRVAPPRPVAPRVVLPRARGQTKTVAKLADPRSGKDVKITFVADRNVDPRALELLAAAATLVESKMSSKELESWQRNVGDGKLAWEITATIAPTPGVDTSRLVIRQPPEFDQPRPGVFRVSAELLASLAKDRRWKVPPRDLGVVAHALHSGPPVTITGVLECGASNTPGSAVTFRSIRDVALTIDGVGATWTPTGYTVTGPIPAGSVPVTIGYRGTAAVGGVGGSMVVVDDIGFPRSDRVNATVALSGATGTATIRVTSTDCETWRLGHAALTDYLTIVGAAPPSGGLSIRRQAGVQSSPGITPSAYAHHDTIVLPTDWTTTYSVEAGETSRRQTVFHEFGHTVAHVADGDFTHWNGDLFRFAYARMHGGCETFNRGFAWNEGWAGYWAAERAGDTPSACADKPGAADTNPWTDWTESLVAARLVSLANAIPGASNSAQRATRMQSVLRSSPGMIHTLRDFEQRYCAMFAAGNPQCASASTPARPAPPACPPGFLDDGLTCRLPNILAKPSQGRGVGTPPVGCSAGMDFAAGLCYPRCGGGFTGVGPVCWQNCPSGFRDDGAYCAKPAPYGRGVGYGWQFGDAPFNLDGARDRCNRDNPAGCEQWGLVWYPRCRANFHAVGCCVCSPDCPAGMPDIGVSCQKQTSTRAPVLPTQCASGHEYDAGLCYPTCPAGMNGVGPVCWGQCPSGYADHGATCYRDPLIVVKV